MNKRYLNNKDRAIKIWPSGRLRPTKEILSRVDVQVLCSTWLLVRVYILMQIETYFKKWCFNTSDVIYMNH